MRISIVPWAGSSEQLIVRSASATAQNKLRIVGTGKLGTVEMDRTNIRLLERPLNAGGAMRFRRKDITQFEEWKSRRFWRGWNAH